MATKQKKSRNDTPIFLSVSQRRAFKKCPWSWSWGYLKRLEPKSSAPPLRFGSLIHAALEAYYIPGVKRGPHPAKTFRRLYDAELESQLAMGWRDDDGVWLDARDLGVAMLRGYVEHYDGDKEWRVLATEHPFEVPVLNRNGKHVANAIGVLDGIWQHRVTKDIAIVDHKAVAQVSTRWLTMDDQSGQYWTFGPEWLYEKGILDRDRHQLAYVLFNFLRKAKPDDRPVNANGERLNQDGSVSKNQPAPYFVRHKSYRDGYDREMMKQRTADEAELILATSAGRLPLIKSPGQFTCNTCAVAEICELHEVGQDYMAMAKAILRKKQYRPQKEAEEYEKAH